MDRGSSAERQPSRAVHELIRQAMPKVAGMVADARRKMGDAHVVECQRRGMAGEPGWFFAREGVLAVGTPWPEIVDLVTWQAFADQGLLCLRPLPVEGQHGA